MPVTVTYKQIAYARETLEIVRDLMEFDRTSLHDRTGEHRYWREILLLALQRVQAADMELSEAQFQPHGPGKVDALTLMMIRGFGGIGRHRLQGMLIGRKMKRAREREEADSEQT